MNLMLEIITQFQHVPTCIVGDFNEDVSLHQIHLLYNVLDYKALSKWSVNQHMIVEQ